MQEVIGSGPRGRFQLLRDQSGLSTVEYVMILVLIAIIAIGTWTFFGGQVRCALGLANDEFSTAVNGSAAAASAQACAKGSSDTAPRPADPSKVKVKRVN